MIKFKNLLLPITSTKTMDFCMLFFRIAISLELIFVHGLKKIGINGLPETVPNPFNMPQSLNEIIAIAANLFFPQLIIMGLFTRLSTLPILAVTLTGYFIVHGNDSLLERDIPFMFSLGYLMIAFAGPGRYSLDHYFFGNKKAAEV
ncbi:DoxX family protein [Pedobacter frigiditerrae]|uniref:DoxX family protein n=1 Tax=Pedobacter frigiditerrae TaxID=2530452 RepID=A0A4R0MQT6_9SPHI|nr:DoxX family protein [Pedobacter frigiditerrae]TCC89228.1 DoxX family protein [Pedobacter frigiditerrae]